MLVLGRLQAEVGRGPGDVIGLKWSSPEKHIVDDDEFHMGDAIGLLLSSPSPSRKSFERNISLLENGRGVRV